MAAQFIDLDGPNGLIQVDQRQIAAMEPDTKLDGEHTKRLYLVGGNTLIIYDTQANLQKIYGAAPAAQPTQE